MGVRLGLIAAGLSALLPFVAGAVPIGDPENGAKVYQRQCAQCHQIGEGATDRLGPNLNRVFDRRFGSVPGFRYSPAIRRMGEEGVTWTIERLDAYITDPRGLIPGTRMSYRGLRDEGQRGDLIAFLRDFSDMPQNIPEASPTALKTLPELPPDVLEIVGDREYGEYLAQECTTCHRRDGAEEGIPSIVGWDEQDFVLVMHAYKQRLRTHQVMQMMASRLADDEIAALAAYFATLD
ncbi:MAG: c-type cytochrome [Gemmobacter sp.]